MNRPHAHQIVFLLLLLPLISGCAFFADTGNRKAPSRGTSTPSSLAAPSCPQHAPIIGTIASVISGNFRDLTDRGAIMVDGANKQLQGHLDRVFYVSIMKGTQILE